MAVKVGIYDMIPPVEAYDLGPLWNGWETPRFTLDTVKKIAKSFCDSYAKMPGYENATAVFHEDTRVWAFFTPDCGETETLTPMTCDGIELWCFDGWCWEKEIS